VTRVTNLTADDLIPIADLKAYLAGKKCGPFKPVPRYSLAGDMLEIHFEDEMAYAEQVNEHLTLLRAFSDKRVVGAKVFGVRGLVEAEVRSAEGK
jgi:hypothetical protein